MSKPLDELFFEWLYSQVADPGTDDPERRYSRVLHQLYTKEFIAVVDRDENRIQDAIELRHEFIAERHIRRRETPDWLDLGCSVLELMVGLSRRMAFDVEGEPHYWFWVMMKNLGLANLSDAYPRYSVRRVNSVLDRLIHREYQHNGKGGLFPLQDPSRDQRNVELWYQMSAYVLELEHS